MENDGFHGISQKRVFTKDRQFHGNCGGRKKVSVPDIRHTLVLYRNGWVDRAGFSTNPTVYYNATWISLKMSNCFDRRKLMTVFGECWVTLSVFDSCNFLRFQCEQDEVLSRSRSSGEYTIVCQRTAPTPRTLKHTYWNFWLIFNSKADRQVVKVISHKAAYSPRCANVPSHEEGTLAPPGKYN